MHQTATYLRPLRVTGALLFAAILIMPPQSFAEPRGGGPFSGMGGHWSGSGTVTLANGAHERLRCRGTNMVDPSGAAMRQVLRCASPSYSLDINSEVVAQGAAVSGSWTESTRGVSGYISGRASPGGIAATISGANFAARLDVRNQGASQSVSIRPTAGTDVAAVSIALRRS